jgi:hypothetical protein
MIFPGMEESSHIALFRGKEIRKTLHNGEWFFVVQDVVSALTDSKDPRQYIKKMRSRDSGLEEGWVQIVPPLSIPTSGGAQMLGCANTEGIFRIVQSIPSPKAEPFKKWLAKVGYERIQEIEDPELATKRTRALYLLNGSMRTRKPPGKGAPLQVKPEASWRRKPGKRWFHLKTTCPLQRGQRS